MKKILVLMGNPDTETFSGRLAKAYTGAAREAGHDIQRINVGELHFNPILHKGYKVIQELEPDLLMVQEKVIWADHIVIVYPNWWCTMPAILKGLFDRMWLPGFAFNFEKPSRKVIQKLKGKTARVIIVAGTHNPLVEWWKFGDYTNEIVHGILGFAGVKAKVTAFGPTEKVGESKLRAWEKAVCKLGRNGV